MSRFWDEIRRNTVELLGWSFSDEEWDTLNELQKVKQEVKQQDKTLTQLVKTRNTLGKYKINTELVSGKVISRKNNTLDVYSSSGVLRTTTVDTNFLQSSSLTYYLRKHLPELKFEQTFSNTEKTIKIVFVSYLESGTLEQKILNDSTACGLLYTLDTKAVAGKPLFVSIEELVNRILSKEWVETTGALNTFL